MMPWKCRAKSNIKNFFNVCQGKFVQGWWLCAIWPINGSALSINKCMPGLHMLLNTPRLTLTSKSWSNKYYFHPFFSILLILKMVVFCWGGVICEPDTGRALLYASNFAFSFYWLSSLWLKYLSFSPQIANWIYFKGHQNLYAVLCLFSLLITFHVSFLLPS